MPDKNISQLSKPPQGSSVVRLSQNAESLGKVLPESGLSFFVHFRRSNGNL